MNVEQRLQHAARELREIQIDVPPLGGGLHRRSRQKMVLQALAAPALFAAGALFAVGAVDTSPTTATFSDVPNALGAFESTTPIAGASTVDEQVISAPSVRAELEMIAEIVSNNRRANAGATATVEPVSDAPPIASERAESIGPL